MLVASHGQVRETVLSVAVDTLPRMEIGLLERRESVNTDIVDDATILEHLACEEPGPLSLMLLESMDPAALDFDGRLNYAKAWDRQQRWATARAQNALSVLRPRRRSPSNEIAAEPALRSFSRRRRRRRLISLHFRRTR